MSILIKGMEMPKDGCHHTICIYADSTVSTGGRAYTAIPVQPHFWVSVADGLPEDGEEVLCWLRNIYGEPYAAVGCYDARFKMWDVDSEYAEPGCVTHWMPLPVKPED